MIEEALTGLVEEAVQVAVVVEEVAVVVEEAVVEEAVVEAEEVVEDVEYDILNNSSVTRKVRIGF